MAERTGLEPATPGVTGRYSNRLNYRSKNTSWWVLKGSNLRPSPCKGDALPAELSTRAPREGALVYCVLQGFASLETGNAARGDVDGIARLRVAALAGCAGLHR